MFATMRKSLKDYAQSINILSCGIEFIYNSSWHIHGVKCVKALNEALGIVQG